MYFNRLIDIPLREWYERTSRKPLLLRGARQIGKTLSIRELGRSFENFVEINFLENSRFHSVFNDADLDINRIVRELTILTGRPLSESNTLLFFDEIQACPRAIESLRFFYEKRPELHLIAAGSLLEFALEDLSSFGVGRVESLHMHPVTFYEFLAAIKHEPLRSQIEAATPSKPLSPVLHQTALTLLKEYMLIGGLPEVVAAFSKDRDPLASGIIIDNLRNGYEDDFAKYRGKVPSQRLRDVLRAVAQQAGSKFVLKHAYVDAGSSQVHQALNLLELAGLVHKVPHSSANGIPLGAEIDIKKFKALPHDLGIFNRLIGLTPRDFISEQFEKLVHQGALAEVFVGLEMLGYSSPRERGELFYWHREARASSAEVDYVIAHNHKIVPIEVKAASKGSMKSLYSFLTDKRSQIKRQDSLQDNLSSQGIRISAENFSKLNEVLVVPLYAVKEIPRLLEH